jgi:ketosteroid isomerase-like protein
MMSEANVATVRAIWDAINRGDIDEAFRYAPDDFVADWSSSEAPESGIFRGRETVKQRFQETRDVWSEAEHFETEIIDAGEQVVRVGGVRARGKGSGAEVTAQGAQLWTFRDGIPVSVRLFQSKEEALEAIGLTA